MLLNRAVTVPGASPAAVMIFTHDSMCEARMPLIGTSAKVVQATVYFILSDVPCTQT